MPSQPYLSVVATSRNDDHGGNTLHRTQIFADSFLEQCEKYGIPGELILVEWNPPPDRAPLADVIDWRRQGSHATCRVITVPYERHILMHYGRQLPLFQMIAKNVGIRRARGEFILATNIDILFSDELAQFIADRKFSKDRLYRCDRYDVDPRVPVDAPNEEKIRYCWSNLVRKNQREHPKEITRLQEDGQSIGEYLDAMEASGHFEVESHDGATALVAKTAVPPEWLHFNTCGDFTLLHRDAWDAIRGYAEFETFSLHIDSLGVECAHYGGFRETWLTPPLVSFHVEHSVGSGYAVEHKEKLFDRLERQGIGWIEYDAIRGLFQEMHDRQECTLFNGESWGFRDIELDETICTPEGNTRHSVPADRQADVFSPVSALLPQYHVELWSTRYLMKRIHETEQQRDEIHRCVKELQKGMAAYKEAFENVQAEAAKIKAAHDQALGYVEDFRGKLTETHRRLAKYRGVFGWMESLGFFR